MILGCLTEDIICISRLIRIKSASVSIFRFLIVLIATYIQRNYKFKFKKYIK